jgi:hypothetical protein
MYVCIFTFKNVLTCPGFSSVEFPAKKFAFFDQLMLQSLQKLEPQLGVKNGTFLIPVTARGTEKWENKNSVRICI